MNTMRLSISSHFSFRSALNSTRPRDCTDAVLFFARRKHAQRLEHTPTRYGGKYHKVDCDGGPALSPAAPRPAMPPPDRLLRFLQAIEILLLAKLQLLAVRANDLPGNRRLARLGESRPEREVSAAPRRSVRRSLPTPRQNGRSSKRRPGLAAGGAKDCRAETLPGRRGPKVREKPSRLGSSLSRFPDNPNRDRLPD